MYQAIVFLPLIGAVIAGLIALAGAHQRHPGGEPGEHGDAEHGPADTHDHAAVAADAEDDDENDAHAHSHASAALGARPAEIITSGFLIVSALLSWVAFFMVGFGGQKTDRLQVFNWFSSGTLSVDWAFRIDPL